MYLVPNVIVFWIINPVMTVNLWLMRDEQCSCFILLITVLYFKIMYLVQMSLIWQHCGTVLKGKYTSLYTIITKLTKITLIYFGVLVVVCKAVWKRSVIRSLLLSLACINNLHKRTTIAKVIQNLQYVNTYKVYWYFAVWLCRVYL